MSLDKYLRCELIKTYLMKKKIIQVCENIFQINKSHDLKLINSGYYFLNNHLNALSKHLKIDRIIIEELNINSQYLLSIKLLTCLSIADPINSIRVMNESVEDKINGIIREIVNNSFTEFKSLNELNKQLNNDLILLRDEYKRYLPPEVVSQNESDKIIGIIHKFKSESSKLNSSLINLLL